MLRIHITGASGSGTSTLAAALAAVLGGVHLESDDYYWLPTSPPFTTKRDRSERLSLLLNDLRASNVAVLAGSVAEWGRDLEDCFDLIVFLCLDTPTRVARLQRRETERFGHVNPAFLEWAAQYDEGLLPGRSLARQRAWLGARSCPVIELRSDASVEELVTTMVQALPRRSLPDDSLR
ncbi:hypothetical protein [Acidovorax radicis]|uniref:hypothetical protein n=1 Tax=Acidovorax radicis TaxID=758826 RepID=UPI00023777BA|nr:hypothetical protein [Acidovorax radicis]